MRGAEVFRAGYVGDACASPTGCVWRGLLLQDNDRPEHRISGTLLATLEEGSCLVSSCVVLLTVSGMLAAPLLLVSEGLMYFLQSVPGT